MRRRILLSVHGSGGDLFPLVPILRGLREAGHDVRCAVPRILSLYLRPWKVPVLHLGGGAELGIGRDGRLLTNRFDGWSSTRQLVDGYLTDSLAGDVRAIDHMVTGGWRPDLVVSSSFGSAARIVAHRCGIARLDLSIYPMLVGKVVRARRFAARYRAECARLAGLASAEDSDLVCELAWGAGPRTILLHDPELLRICHVPSEIPAPGFPYWDDAPARDAEIVSVTQWLRQRSTGPTIAVTMGSYLGATQRDFWEALVEATTKLGIRGVLLGPRQMLRGLVDRTSESHCVAGYVPLSLVAEHVDAIVHHGGIGTMFAALFAGKPAVVVPRSFDQPFNARLVERAGVGLSATTATLSEVLAQVVNDRDMAMLAEAMPKTLVPSEVASARAVEAVLSQV
jgi:UDP:flavonoid glycosyltransferase YjiC (YdhE family)